MKMIGNVSDWLSYAGGALIKVADSAGSTVMSHKDTLTSSVRFKVMSRFTLILDIKGLSFELNNVIGTD